MYSNSAGISVDTHFAGLSELSAIKVSVMSDPSFQRNISQKSIKKKIELIILIFLFHLKKNCKICPNFYASSKKKFFKFAQIFMPHLKKKIVKSAQIFMPQLGIWLLQKASEIKYKKSKMISASPIQSQLDRKRLHYL